MYPDFFIMSCVLFWDREGICDTSGPSTLETLEIIGELCDRLHEAQYGSWAQTSFAIGTSDHHRINREDSKGLLEVWRPLGVQICSVRLFTLDRLGFSMVFIVLPIRGDCALFIRFDSKGLALPPLRGSWVFALLVCKTDTPIGYYQMPNTVQHVCLELMTVSHKWPVTTGDVRGCLIPISPKEESSHDLHRARLCLGERTYAAGRFGEGLCKRCRMQNGSAGTEVYQSGPIWINVTSKCIKRPVVFFGRSKMWTSAILPGTHATWHRTEQGVEASGGTEGSRWMGMAEACSTVHGQIVQELGKSFVAATKTSSNWIVSFFPKMILILIHRFFITFIVKHFFLRW